MYSMLAAASIDTTTFMTTAFGKAMQKATQVLAFPFFVVVTFTVFRRLWRRSHKEAFLMFGLTCAITAMMVDWTILANLANVAITLGGDIFNFFQSMFA